jgi:hypothetical protein
MRLDRAQIFCGETRAMLPRRILEESIHEPVGSGRQGANKARQVRCTALDRVKAANIQRQIEGPAYAGQPSDVTCAGVAVTPAGRALRADPDGPGVVGP